jgi:UDP-3-O-[3-hydroxymyristoyl] glucosamine N-acyltransferase
MELLESPMKLSDHFPNSDIARDGEFDTLGHVDSAIKKTLVFCDNIRYLDKADNNTNVSAIITTLDLLSQISPNRAVLISVNPRSTFYKLHQLMLEKGQYSLNLDCGIGKNCSVHPSALVSPMTRIGNDVTISENVVIKDGVSIGDNTYIDAGVIIGCEGLLYTKEGEKITFIRHAGGVQVGKNVTLLSQATIVRSVHPGFLTVIGDNSIIGISSNIGHDAQIGKNCSISSNCVIARKAKLGDGVWVGPSSAIREHVNIGPNSRIRLGSVVIEDVKANESVSGNFALNHPANLRNFVKKKIGF